MSDEWWDPETAAPTAELAAAMRRDANRAALNGRNSAAAGYRTVADRLESLAAAVAAVRADQQGRPGADGEMPSTDTYLESELFVAGALSTLPPFTTFHPAWCLPFARQALAALSEWEPSDASSPGAVTIDDRMAGDIVGLVGLARRSAVQYPDIARSVASKAEAVAAALASAVDPSTLETWDFPAAAPSGADQQEPDGLADLIEELRLAWERCDTRSGEGTATVLVAVGHLFAAAPPSTPGAPEARPDERQQLIEWADEAWALCPEHGPRCVGGEECCCYDKHAAPPPAVQGAPGLPDALNALVEAHDAELEAMGSREHMGAMDDLCEAACAVVEAWRGCAPVAPSTDPAPEPGDAT